MDKIFKLFLLISTLNNFHIAILDKLGILHGKIIYTTRNYNMKFFARAGTEDMSEIVVVTSGSEYDFGLINLSKEPTIIDLGGHIGSFTIWTAKKFKNKAKIVTIEPDIENYELLTQNININNIKHIETINAAVSDYNGRGFLKTANLNTDAYHLDYPGSKSSNTRVYTIKKILEPYKLSKIDLIKMDIEGGEYQLFRSKQTMKYLEKNVKYVFMEYHEINKKNNLQTLINLLHNKFEISKNKKNILVLKNKSLNYQNAK